MKHRIEVGPAECPECVRQEQRFGAPRFHAEAQDAAIAAAVREAAGDMNPVEWVIEKGNTYDNYLAPIADALRKHIGDKA